MAVTADTPADKAVLARLFTHIATATRTAEEKLSRLFEYAPSANGVRFRLADMSRWVADTANTAPGSITTAKGEVIADTSHDYVVAPGGIPRQTTLTEQRLTAAETIVLPMADIVAVDDPRRLLSLVRRMIAEKPNKGSRAATMAGAAAAGFAAGWAVARLAQ